MTSWTRWALPIVVFGLAVTVRVAGLGGFLTADEPLWIDRSRHFIGGMLFPDYTCPSTDRGRNFEASGWSCTLQSEHPGVTTMGAGGLGLLLYYWQTVRPTGLDLPTFLTSIDMGELDPTLITAVRLPLAITGGAFVALFYLLLRRLLAEAVALGAALLLALTPFHVALSRVIHHDALTTTFMTLSLLALLGYWLRGWGRVWLFWSGVAAGLAFLSKPASWFLIPFAVLLAGLSLLAEFFTPAAWRTPLCRSRLRRRSLEFGLWALTAALIYVILFPAMWTIPGEVMRVAFGQSLKAAEEGHGLYFLGQVSDDPGLLFYPLSWLLQVTPLETLGLLAAFVGVFTAFKFHAFKVFDLVRHRPVELALALFGLIFLVFATLSAKKLARYFLPAFPIIEIFVAFGLLWLTQTLLRYLQPFKPAKVLGSWPYFSILLLLIQGIPTLAHYPYYFTYYNPLLGGAPAAAQLTTVGFGEGVNEAAAYLNQLPNAADLSVVVCGNDDLFEPFFVGQVRHCTEAEIFQSDYVVYYLKTIQLQRDQATWSYLSKHYLPVYRVNLSGLDYVFIYRNPVEYSVNIHDNSLPGALTTYGYNLSSDGQLTLVWQNQGLGRQALWINLVSPTETTETGHWAACKLAPAFEDEATTSGEIVESKCLLTETNPASPGLYSVQLGFGESTNISPVPASGLALVKFDEPKQFAQVDPSTALTNLATQALPAGAFSLAVAYGDRLRLVGYQFEPTVWQPDRAGELILYWQAARRPDFGLANAVQIGLRLLTSEQSQPIATVTQPMLSASIADHAWSQGAVMPGRYSFAMPADVQPGQYTLAVCLTIAESGQVVPGTVTGGTQPVECVPLSVKIAG